jgi:hypothetical protein
MSKKNLFLVLFSLFFLRAPLARADGYTCGQCWESVCYCQNGGTQVSYGDFCPYCDVQASKSPAKARMFTSLADDDLGTCYYGPDCQGQVRFSNGSNWMCGSGQSWRSYGTGACINH